MRKLQVCFSIEVNEMVSFSLHIDGDKFLSCNVEEIAKEKAKLMQDQGWLNGIDFDEEEFFFGKIIYCGKTWIDT